jgi:diguanylate cyclase (GGDEF)-like protein
VSAQATLSRLARTDALTGLANRRALDQSLRDLVRRDVQQAECVSLLFADIDRFKHYNDTYGHVAGDAALVKVAECLKSLPVRAGASARYGGEEFVVLLPGVHSSDALEIAELLRDRVYQLAIEHAGSPLDVLTISVGVATSDAVTQCDPLRLLKHADQALYEAKSIGRNSVVCYRERYDAENSAAA